MHLFTSNRSVSGKKRVLIVNCYFDDSRLPLRRTFKFPQPMAPAYLAGYFSRELCDVRCYNEVSDGPLEDEHLLAWPDVLVLSGLTNSFDRMLHLTAYARTKNPRVVIVGGGPPVRMLPFLAKKVFDYACVGDAEEIASVVREALGNEYLAEVPLPRFDLASWTRGVGYLETTRYCNFRCAFCALTAEGRPYQPYDLQIIRRHLQAAGKHKKLFFLDNNFYGSDRAHFIARLDLLKEMRLSGHFDNWGALVTSDFFQKDENLRLARESGCELLFSGVESFDADWLRSFSKLQNVRAPQVDVIRKCLNAGIIFIYGLIVDITARSLDDIRRELDFIVGTPEITLPCFLTTSIPLLGTPYFFEAVKKGTILPKTKLRDLDGTTITQTPVDSLADAVTFMRHLQTFRGHRRRAFKHDLGFVKTYRHKLNPLQLSIGAGMGLMLSTQSVSTGSLPFRGKRRPAARTFVSTTEPLDHMYDPAFRVEARFQKYFQPTMITGAKGELHDDILASGLFERGLVQAIPA
jgi:hopanoid C-2 methylase